MPSRKPARTAPRRSLTAAGWVPNQHGAWAMLVVPLLLGLTLRQLAPLGLPGGPAAELPLVRPGGMEWGRALALTVVWFMGYFCFHATSLWLKSRRKPRYVRPLVTYALAGAAGGVGVLLTAASLADWLVAFAPLLTGALVAAARRTERSLAAGLATTAAASLMAPVAYSDSLRTFVAALPAGLSPYPHGATFVAVVTLAVFAYFAGTIFVVKTVIRERGKRSWVWASVLYHLAWTLVFCVGALRWHTCWWLVVFFAVCTVRAGVVPALDARRRIAPARLGLAEIAFTIALTLVVLGSAGLA